MKKVELTPEQIRDIYNAGYKNGERDQSAREWGTCTSDEEKDMISSIAEIIGTTVEEAAEILGALADVG